MSSTGDKNSEVTSVPRSGGSLIKISGVIDETFDPRQVLEHAQGVLVFDLQGVERITSFGVRKWITALQALPDVYYCFTRCRPALVTQFNLTNKFAVNGQLLSLYAPYLCLKCKKPTEVLLDLRIAFEAVQSFSPPPLRCPSCAGECEFDDVPEMYFSYAASAVVPTPPSVVDNILSGSSTPEAPFKAELDVEGDFSALWLSGALQKEASLKRLSSGLEGTVLVVMHGLGPVSAAGLEGLKQLFAQTSATFYVARISEELLQVLRNNPALHRGAKIASARLPISCAECQARPVFEVGPGRPPPPCPQCGAGLRIKPPTAGLTWGSTPEIDAYLAERPEANPQPLPKQADVWNASSGTTQLFGRYELLRRLGAGGMAEVFLARQTGTAGFEKKIVVKRILPHLTREKEFSSMFFEEAKLAARISHPNVVQIFDLGQVGHRYFIAMEYVRGSDLKNLLRLAGKLREPPPINVVCKLFIDICAGLHAAHTCTDEDGRPLGVLHRDISPHNVLVSLDGQVKVADFGIARPDSLEAQQPTGVLKGKMAYLAPEQINGEHRIDRRADIFAVGISLYETLTLTNFFRRNTEPQTLRAILFERPPPPSSSRAEIPPELDDIVLRALARTPSERYSSAQQLQLDLESLIIRLGLTGTSQVAAWASGLLSRADEVAGGAEVRGATVPAAGAIIAPRTGEDATPVMGDTERWRKGGP